MVYFRSAALFATLPTQPNAVRLRVWRNLKALGCGALRDGVSEARRRMRTLADSLQAMQAIDCLRGPALGQLCAALGSTDSPAPG